MEAEDYIGNWDSIGEDLTRRYAKFTSRTLTDDEVLWLSLASKVMPAGCPGAMLFLTSASQADCYFADIREWGTMVAEGIAKSKYKGGHGRKNRRTYVEGYDIRWGRQAALDGLAVAMFGLGVAPSLHDRAAEFQVRQEAYKRIRDFVAGAALAAIIEFRWALLWAAGRVRSAEFDYRVESQVKSDSKWNGCVLISSV